MGLGGAPSVGLDRISAFEHLQALIANGPDVQDLDEFDDVITRVAAFCKSSSFLAQVEEFCCRHAASFAGQSSSEYPLAWTGLHEQYATLVESNLEGFLLAQGTSNADFVKECQAVLARSRGESRWNRDAMVVQVLTASTEFEEWVALMRLAAEQDEEEDDDRFAPPDSEDEPGATATAARSPINLS